MNQTFHHVEPKSLTENPFSMLDDAWMLITAGDMEKHNTMTASWGGVGVIWNKPVATIYVRPQRYTYEFTEENEYFTLSVFTEEYRKALTYCGRNSGRDVDKDKECGLTPFLAKDDIAGSVAYQEARLVFVCKKLYAQDLVPESFIDPTLAEKNYPSNDFHRMYIGEIVAVLEK